ncbi:putative Sphingoid long-chain base transporter RSB1 [Glarea lozoyensis 74030]|uniref:Putative Sphingoid long-chain base transporter RSB1 n=1 Tax=Glarea lozoyensis (strain ATCC 74030 / MF5533) TaxID=1104152 RepID=H0EMY2_GLAL7|nr:putative Sphingoid long-chain base transporter RSB1 [Glarea lozoyensis 74030]
MPDSTDDCKSVSPSCPIEDTVYGYAPNLGGNAFYALVFAISGTSDGLAFLPGGSVVHNTESTSDFTIRICKRHGTGVFTALQKNLKIFLLGMTAAFLLILTRCIYRIPELAGGVGGHLMRQEVEFMIFDGLLILLSAILLSAGQLKAKSAAKGNCVAWLDKHMFDGV